MTAQTAIPTLYDAAVDLIDGKPMCTSNDIARHFGKQHKNVLQAIDMLELPDDFRQLNFQPIEYTDERGRKQPCYQITRDGFTLLAMGFTGKRAMAWKLAYLAAFNAMEAQLMIDADRALQPPSLLRRRWLVVVDHDGNESFEALPDSAAVVTRETLPGIVKQCFPEFALVRRDVLAKLEVC